MDLEILQNVIELWQKMSSHYFHRLPIRKNKEEGKGREEEVEEEKEREAGEKGVEEEEMEVKMGSWAMRRWNRKSTFFLLVLFGAAIFVHSNFRVSYWWKLIVDRHLPRFLFRFPAPGLTTTTSNTTKKATQQFGRSFALLTQLRYQNKFRAKILAKE